MALRPNKNRIRLHWLLLVLFIVGVAAAVGIWTREVSTFLVVGALLGGLAAFEAIFWVGAAWLDKRLRRRA